MSNRLLVSVTILLCFTVLAKADGPHRRFDYCTCCIAVGRCSLEDGKRSFLKDTANYQGSPMIDFYKWLGGKDTGKVTENDILALLGDEGWELITISADGDYYHFKREKQ